MIRIIVFTFSLLALLPGMLIAEPDTLENRFYNIALASFKNKDYTLASKQFEAILSIYPAHKNSQLYLKKIKLLLKSTKYKKEARKQVNKLWALALADYNKGNIDQAKVFFNDILRLDPDHAGAKGYLSKLDGSLGTIASAHVNELYSQALDHYVNGQYQEAIKYFETTTQAALKYFEAVVLDQPQSLDTLEFIEDCKQKIKEEEERVENMEKDKIKERILTLYQRGEKYLKKGYLDAAFAELNAAKGISVQFKVDISADEITRRLDQTRGELAGKYEEKAAKQYAENDFENAFSNYKKAAALNETDKETKNRISSLGVILGKKTYEEGMKYFSEGNTIKAKEYFNKSLEYDPSLKESQRALERIQ